ncbi:hypothetical protein [Nocardia sp. alder85J]|uniref:hypothetical protein n=1 Tax=Nocardia sp. alder85J TaxID=2862949 RepID=UPI001CD53A5D|nr:hypothetical protein [Nocardia sp. alder85J]MCX4093334.1 hypothetical protein [Nocardia sp. alder85J]
MDEADRATADPIALDRRRSELRDRLIALRTELAGLTADYRALPRAGVLLDTPGIGALTTPGYCIAGAVEILEETAIELAAADDALGRAGVYTGRLRPVPL